MLYGSALGASASKCSYELDKRAEEGLDALPFNVRKKLEQRLEEIAEEPWRGKRLK